MIDGLGIDMGTTTPYSMAVQSVREAHAFGELGGVTGAVKAYLKEKAESLQAIQVSNLTKKNIAMLRAYGKSGKAPAKFIEVMACEGGCITGPCVHNELKAGKRQFDKELGKETKTYDDMD